MGREAPEKYEFIRQYTLRSYGEGAVVIRAAQQPAALEAMKALVRRAEMQGRGLYLHEGVLSAATLQQGVAAWTGGAVQLIDETQSGDVTSLLVGRMSDPGRLAVMLNALAPYVESGSHLELVDSSRAMWSWYFEGGRARNEFTY